MNFAEIPRAIFLEKLEMVLPVIPTRTHFPVLQNVLLTFREDNIHLLATDLDTSVSINLSFPEKNFPEAKLFVRARELTEILKGVTEPVITLETEENILKIKTDKGEYTFSLLDPQEFPELPPPPKEEEFDFPSSLLYELFANTSFAVSKETDRPAISGILWEIRENETRMVATDGHRLALIKKEGEFGKIKKLQAILPPKVLEIIPKNDEEKIKVTLNSTQISFRGESYQITSRLIEGPYPDYEKVLPTKYPYSLVCPKNELFAALTRTLVFAPLTKLVIFHLKKKGSFLEASSEIGIGKEEIKSQYKGEELKIGFNATSFNEILRHINSEEVELEFASATQALLIRPKDEEERKEKLFLLMPMRLE